MSGRKLTEFWNNDALNNWPLNIDPYKCTYLRTKKKNKAYVNSDKHEAPSHESLAGREILEPAV